MDIAKETLGRLVELDRGNFGVVHSAPDLSLPDVPGPLLVKIMKGKLDKSEAERLRTIVTWRAALSPSERTQLDALAAWPVRVVVENRRVVGIVMSRAPERFFFDFTPEARNAQTHRALIKILPFFEPATVGRSSGIALPDDDDILSRLIVCARLAQFFRLLHAHHVVYGDVSGGNVLVSAQPAPPEIMMIDCDAAYPPGLNHGNRQNGTPSWQSPEEKAGGAELDLQTDVYKLCLAIMRTLVVHQRVLQISDPKWFRGVLDQPGTDLITRGLGKNRVDRPTADEIYRYLIAEIDGQTAPPEINRCEVSEPYLVVGASFDLMIDIEYATTITVRTPEGRMLDVPPAQAHSALRIAAVESGSYIVTARNSFGTVSAESTAVRVVRPPDLIAVHYPEPDIPALEAGDMAVLRRGLEAAEATNAQLASPFEQLARFRRELAVYDGLYAPTQAISDRMRLPADLHSGMRAPVRFDPRLNPLQWPVPKTRRRLRDRLTRFTREARR